MWNGIQDGSKYYLAIVKGVVNKLIFRSVNLGHYHVDFDSEEKTRTPKESAEYYRKVTATSCLVDSCEATSTSVKHLTGL